MHMGDNTKEIFNHLYQAILKIPPFKLKDGIECKVDPYYAPEERPDGAVKCGIDILLPDGHLEFTVEQTGWGRAIQVERAVKPPKCGR
jgi:hypothetical protein